MPARFFYFIFHQFHSMDVNCYIKDFVALTNDGAIHQWTHGITNLIINIYSISSTPTTHQGPFIYKRDILKSIFVEVGMSIEVT